MAELPFPDPPLGDEIIRLRSWSQNDLDAVHEATQDVLISRFTRVPNHQTKEDIRRFIEGREPARQSGNVLPLVIADARSDELLGTISLMGLEWEQRRAGVGFWLAPRARGQGVATRAVTLLSRWALTEFGPARFQLGAIPTTTRLSALPNAAASSGRECCGLSWKSRAAATTL